MSTVNTLVQQAWAAHRTWHGISSIAGADMVRDLASALEAAEARIAALEADLDQVRKLADTFVTIAREKEEQSFLLGHTNSGLIAQVSALEAENGALREKVAGMSQGSRDVLAERERQVSEKGWTVEHDDGHTRSELASAAACYMVTVTWDDRSRELYGSTRPPFWPWETTAWKPTDRRSDLVKACALGIAEIERLDRAALRQAEEKSDG